MEKIEIRDDLKIIFFKVGDVISIKSFLHYFSYIEHLKKRIKEYNRFTDMSATMNIQLSPADLENISSAVIKSRARAHTKSSIFCNNEEIKKQVEYMFKIVMPKYKNVLCSTNLLECAKYLNINIDILKNFTERCI